MQPERHIEKLLRAFARKRREQTGEDFNLHPATRRLLQGEAARRFAQAQRERRPWWRECVRFGPRLGFAAALLAILGVCAFLLYPPAKSPHQTLSLAKGKSASQEPDARYEPTPAPVNLPAVPATQFAHELAATPPPTALAESVQPKETRPVDELLDKDARTLTLSATPRGADAVNRSKLLVAKSKGEPAPVASPNTAAPALSDQVMTFAAPAPRTDSEASYSREATVVAVSKKTESADLTISDASATQSSRRTPASAGVALADRRRYGLESAAATTAKSARSSNPAIVQRYYQLGTEKGTASRERGGVNAVLMAFQFEQQGQAVRIVDGDGSVYTGAVGTITAPTLAAVHNRPAGAADDASKAKLALQGDTQAAGLVGGLEAALPVTSFTVRGTNATLRQIVTFVGQVQPEVLTNQIGASNQTVYYAPQVALQNALQNSQVTGRARLADGRELEIKALALPPNIGKK